MKVFSKNIQAETCLRSGFVARVKRNKMDREKVNLFFVAGNICKIINKFLVMVPKSLWSLKFPKKDINKSVFFDL